MKKILFAAFASIFLTACVTEEGAKKHAMKGEDSSQWHGEVFEKGAKSVADVGTFGSHEKCMKETSMRMREFANSDSYACTRM